MSTELLIVGEASIDFSQALPASECKLRLGGIAHAARGLWAAGLPYSVATFCPKYLVDEARRFLTAHGCQEFICLGEIVGSPNVTVIGDPLEIGHQGYEDLLRECRTVSSFQPPADLAHFENVLIFPGAFDLGSLLAILAPDAKISVDIAYGIESLSALRILKGRLSAIMISTSSPLFLSEAKGDVSRLIAELKPLAPEVFLLKENRGGSRLFALSDGDVDEIPATLTKTANSVGVGDVYSAVMLALSGKGWAEAAWRGCQAATAYAETTYPDDFRRNLLRGFKLSVDELRTLGGTSLPWHERPNFPIYLAAPDFSNFFKPELDRAVESLQYHNFKLRRPVHENGELVRPARRAEMDLAFHMDYELLRECTAVFAVPLDRDPGTLVETGMAIALGKPVITYDPRNENANTMVVAGSTVYSTDLEECLTGTFELLSRLRAKAR